ncbi:MAG: bile acid:sodium symporter family protein [Bacteroidales bacterium]|nr:bile acid:sodium symporter family protein [Bacteroidales bacterium]
MHALEALDHVRLNFSPASLHILNLTLAFVMFGVALDIKIQHFKDIFFKPKSAIVGVFSQFIALPFFTFLLVVLLKDYITPTIALGMILVAACPGGNISNFISALAKGNAALSVSLTAFATISAVFMTPLNFAFWGKLYTGIIERSNADQLVRPLDIDFSQMFQTVFLILGIPLILGLFINHKWPNLAKKIIGPLKKLSILAFVAIVIFAFAKNFHHFMLYVKYVFFIVLAHNALALGTGYTLGRIFKLPKKDKKTISIETGIQNSGLALVLIFNPKIFPPDMELGGMAIIAAWWGIWHMVSGLTMAYFWSGTYKKINFSYLTNIIRNGD